MNILKGALEKIRFFGASRKKILMEILFSVKYLVKKVFNFSKKKFENFYFLSKSKFLNKFY